MDRVPVQVPINAAQMDYMVKKLSANSALTQGNWDDPLIKAEWVSLANELNRLGFARTVEEWRDASVTSPPATALGDLPGITVSPGRLVEDPGARLTPSPDTVEVTSTPESVNIDSGSTLNFSEARESRHLPYSRPRTRPRSSRVQRPDTAATIAAVRENGRLIHEGLMAVAEALRNLATIVNRHNN